MHFQQLQPFARATWHDRQMGFTEKDPSTKLCKTLACFNTRGEQELLGGTRKKNHSRADPVAFVHFWSALMAVNETMMVWMKAELSTALPWVPFYSLWWETGWLQCEITSHPKQHCLSKTTASAERNGRSVSCRVPELLKSLWAFDVQPEHKGLGSAMGPMRVNWSCEWFHELLPWGVA